MLEGSELSQEIRELRQVIKDFLLKQSAAIRYSSDANPFSMQRIVLDLTTARVEGDPFRIGFPITGLHVESATSSSTKVKMSLNAPTIDQIRNYKEIKLNDVMQFDKPISGASITWAAQSGQTMTIVVFVDVKFASGSQVSVTSGGVSITEGDAWSHDAAIACNGSTATELLNANTNRKLGVIQNDSAYKLYLGSTSAVTSTTGLLVEPGQTFETRYTGDVWGIYETGGSGSPRYSEFT